MYRSENKDMCASCAFSTWRGFTVFCDRLEEYLLPTAPACDDYEERYGYKTESD